MNFHLLPLLYSPAMIKNSNYEIINPFAICELKAQKVDKKYIFWRTDSEP